MGLLLFLFGLLFGSFANVCIWRVPRGESVVSPRSHCPGCGTGIPWYYNVPLLSYLVLRGRCAGCRARISLRYPLVELLCGALFAAQWARFPFGPLLVLGAALSFSLLVVSAIDLEHQIIPDVFSVGLLAAGLAGSPWNASLGATPGGRAAASAAGAVFGFSVMFALAWGGEKMFKKEALGGGDVKLMMGVGSFIGWKGVFIALFTGSLAGTVVVMGLMAGRRLKRGDYLPFGPFLAAGSWAAWMWGYRLFPFFGLPFR